MSARTLRVLAVSDFYLPRSGGVERVVHETARRLARHGVEVEVLTRRLEPGDAASERIDGVRVHRVGRPGGPLVLERRRLAREIRAWAGNALGSYDLVHAHLTLTAVPLLPLIAERGLPLVATYYGPWHQEYREEMRSPAVPSRWPGPLRALMVPWVASSLFRLQRQVLLAARRVVVLSEHSRRELSELAFGVDVPIERVPGGVDVERFFPRDPLAARGQVRGLEGASSPLLVAVRRLVPRMGLDSLLDAVHRIRPSYPQLTLAIGGSGPLAQSLAREGQRLGLGTGLRLLGSVPEAELPWLYAAADLSVLPTRALEGFGLPVLESWAAGVPVVATRRGALEELVQMQGEGWLSDGTGGADLACAIELGLSARSPRLSERVRALALSYSWESVSEQLALVYRRCLAGSAPA